MPARSPRPNSHVVYRLILAAFAWCFLAMASAGVLPLGFELVAPARGPVLAFLVFGIAARAMGFRLYGHLTVSLDSAFYIAALLTIGVLPTAWIVATVISFDLLWRMISQRLMKRSSRRLIEIVAITVSRGAVPAALIVLTGVAFGLGSSHLEGPASHARLLWLVPSLSLSLVIPVYGLLGVGLWLEGHGMRTVLRRAIAPALVAEVVLIPLSVVMVAVFDPREGFPFILLGVTFVLLNLVIKLLADSMWKLSQRLAEVEVLGEVGRAIASNLDLEEVVPQIARETVKLVGATSKCMVGILDETGANVRLEVYDASGECIERDGVPLGEGLTGQVMRRRGTILLNDLQREFRAYGLDEAYNDTTVHSWMGAPLITQDEVIGILNVQSEVRGAYNPDRIRVFETIAAQAAVAIENARLYQLATVDGLTGLYVRRYFDLRLREEIRVSVRYGSDFSVLLLDLDDFKRLNDTYGHPVGDKVLKEAAHVVRDRIRASDIACRYGGEEFACVMPRTTLDEAVQVAERIRVGMAELAMEVAGERLGVSVSIGGASFATGSAAGEDLVDRADEALYRAKALGKNRVVAADPKGRSLQDLVDTGLEAG